jgi:hypothetical protein
MRKLIIVILALAFVFSFTACGKNSGNEDQANSTAPQSSDDENISVTTIPTISPDEPTQIRGRCELWDAVFKAGDFRINSNSFTMSWGDDAQIIFLSDDTGKSYISASGSIDVAAVIGSTLYKYDDSTIYFNTRSSIEEEVVDRWYLCEITSEEDIATLNNAMMDKTDVVAITNILNFAEKVDYIESIGDIDYIDVYCVPMEDGDDDVEGPQLLSYDASICVEYNGAVGQLRYTELSSAEGLRPVISIQWESEIENMDLADWSFDKESVTLISDVDSSQVVKCSVVRDYLNTELDPIGVRVVINSKTLDIQKLSWLDGDYTVAIEFKNCDNVEALVDIPDDIAEKVPVVDAAIQHNMTVSILSSR